MITKEWSALAEQYRNIKLSWPLFLELPLVFNISVFQYNSKYWSRIGSTAFFISLTSSGSMNL